MHWFHFEVIVLVLMLFACMFAAGVMFFNAIRDIRRANRIEKEAKRREPRH